LVVVAAGVLVEGSLCLKLSLYQLQEINQKE